MLLDDGTLDFVCTPVDAVNLDPESVIDFEIRHSSTGELVLSKQIAFHELFRSMLMNLIL